MFRQLGIYSSEGQLYEPVDADELAAYRESKDGQVLEEGINEAGAFAAWLAAATSYSTHQYTLIPFYLFYSMFGFQRVGDLAWAAGDMQARGFLLGATSGRTTLNGEGLQHQDGHSHLLSGAVPNCVSYDPCYVYELAVIIQDGLRRMYVEDERIFYYVTIMNENYTQPAIPDGVTNGILRGMYKLVSIDRSGSKRKIRLLGSGAILNEVMKASIRLERDYDVDAEVWSVTSFTELARDGHDVARWNMLHPAEQSQRGYVSECLEGDTPVVAATDYVKHHAESIRGFIQAPYRVLGTDGFGRSDTREQLRGFFEVDDRFVTLAALTELANAQVIAQSDVKDAIEDMGIAPDKSNPRRS